jgi:integrase
VLGLRWEDVNFQKQTLTVSGSLQRQNGRLERTDPKTDTSHRVLPLPRVLAQALQAHRRRQDNQRVIAGDDWKEHGLVFTTSLGTPIEPRGLVRHFKQVLKLAGLPETTRFHDLRHACATLLIAQGVHPRVVMEILGHSNISITMNTYAHVLPQVSRDAADKLDALLMPDESRSEDQEGDDMGDDEYDRDAEENQEL